MHDTTGILQLSRGKSLKELSSKNIFSNSTSLVYEDSKSNFKPLRKICVVTSSCGIWRDLTTLDVHQTVLHVVDKFFPRHYSETAIVSKCIKIKIIISAYVWKPIYLRDGGKAIWLQSSAQINLSLRYQSKTKSVSLQLITGTPWLYLILTDLIPVW